MVIYILGNSSNLISVNQSKALNRNNYTIKYSFPNNNIRKSYWITSFVDIHTIRWWIDVLLFLSKSYKGVKMFEFLKPLTKGLFEAVKSQSIEFVNFIKDKKGKKI